MTRAVWEPAAAAEPVAPTFGSERLPPRMWEKMRVTDSGCWEWTAARYANGYGMTNVRRQLWRPHRLVYLVFTGPIPDGADLDHYMWPDGGCIGRACALHTRPATRRENLLRGEGVTALHATKKHCPREHAYEGSNLYIDPTGGRRCRECRRITDAARSAGVPVGMAGHVEQQRAFLASRPRWASST